MLSISRKEWEELAMQHHSFFLEHNHNSDSPKWKFFYCKERSPNWLNWLSWICLVCKSHHEQDYHRHRWFNWFWCPRWDDSKFLIVNWVMPKMITKTIIMNIESVQRILGWKHTKSILFLTLPLTNLHPRIFFWKQQPPLKKGIKQSYHCCC